MWNMYWSKNWAQSVFRLSLVKPKPKLSPQPIRRKENTLKSQGEVKVKPSKLPKARETRVTKLRLVLVLHLIGWESGTSFFGPINATKQSKAKLIRFRIIFNTKLETARKPNESQFMYLLKDKCHSLARDLYQRNTSFLELKLQLFRSRSHFFFFNIPSEIRSVIGFPRGTQSLGVPVSVKVPYRRKAKRILLTNSIDIVYIRVSRTLPRVVQVITQWKRLLKNHYTLVWFAITLVPFICIRSTPTFSKVLQPKVCKASLSCCLGTTAGQATVH